MITSPFQNKNLLLLATTFHGILFWYFHFICSFSLFHPDLKHLHPSLPCLTHLSHHFLFYLKWNCSATVFQTLSVKNLTQKQHGSGFIFLISKTCEDISASKEALWMVQSILKPVPPTYLPLVGTWVPSFC